MLQQVQDNVALTARDLAILLDCYKETLLTNKQIEKRHFTGRAKSTMIERLTKLRRGGYLTAERIDMNRYERKELRSGIVHLITTKGLQVLQSLFSNEHFKDEPPNYRYGNVVHDVVLIEVIAALRTKFTGIDIRNERVVDLSGGDSNIRPDAIIFDQNGRVHTAIELEMSDKSLLRYRENTGDYQSQFSFKQIIYICDKPRFSRHLRSEINPVKQQADEGPVFTDRFYFASVEELLNKPLTATITNGRAEYSPPRLVSEFSNSKGGDNAFCNEVAHT
ncbi:MAG: replication-relaxation family protein [Bacteriovoracia bacterium]